MLHPDWNNIVKEAWKVEESLMSTIANFQQVIQMWNSSMFGNIFHNKRRTLARIRGLQSVIERSWSLWLINLEKNSLS